MSIVRSENPPLPDLPRVDFERRPLVAQLIIKHCRPSDDYGARCLVCRPLDLACESDCYSGNLALGLLAASSGRNSIAPVSDLSFFTKPLDPNRSEHEQRLLRVYAWIVRTVVFDFQRNRYLIPTMPRLEQLPGDESLNLPEPQHGIVLKENA